MDSTSGDAFAFLLDDLDHEDLAHSLMLECAPSASVIAAALAQPAASSLHTPTQQLPQQPPPPPPLQPTSQPPNAFGDLTGLFSSAGGLGALLSGGGGGLSGLLGGGGGGLAGLLGGGGGSGGLAGLLGGGSGGLAGLLSGGAGGLGALLGEGSGAGAGAGLSGLVDAFGGPASVLQLLQSPLVAPHQEQIMRLMSGTTTTNATTTTSASASPAVPTGVELLLQQFRHTASDNDDGDNETDVVSPPSVGGMSAFTTTDDSNTEDEKPSSPSSPVSRRLLKPTTAHALDLDDEPEHEHELPRKPPMENSTRKRQKEELAYLREKVRELETELSAMKDRARASATGRPGAAKRLQTAPGVASTASDREEDDDEDEDEAKTADGSSVAMVAAAPVGKVSLWERVAKRQLIEKQKAEVKNQKLKEALEYQLKVAKSLEKVLKKRPGATVRVVWSCVSRLLGMSGVGCWVLGVGCRVSSIKYRACRNH